MSEQTELNLGTEIDWALEWLDRHVHWFVMRRPTAKFPTWQFMLHHRKAEASDPPMSFSADHFSEAVEAALQWVIDERARLNLRGG